MPADDATGARYTRHHMLVDGGVMKPKKLTLRRDTVRHLGRIDLARAVGGAADTAPLTCPGTQAALDTFDVHCPRPALDTLDLTCPGR